MQATERIVVSKIYVGSAALFGLLYGLVIGLIMVIIFLIGGLTGFQGEGSFLANLIPFGGFYVLAIAILVFYVIGGLIAMVISALLYNLVAKLGGKLHIGLAEYEKKVEPMNAMKAAKNVQVKAGTGSGIKVGTAR